MTLEVVSIRRAFGGDQGVYRHRSATTGTDMVFSVYLPPAARLGPCPVVTYLSGLTCTHANVTEKGEYRRTASELGQIVVCPDVSPRGPDAPDDPDEALGQGAGFYVDARREPWAAHYQMERYVVEELPALIAENFPVDVERQGIFGHSMGGHGALTLALRHPGRWRSVSAFAPIAAPSQAPWGRNAFSAYLGPDEIKWREHDATALIASGRRAPHILVDIGEADPFLQQQLRPELLASACEAAKQPLTLRRHEGYDHSYYFISTFMEDHLRWHAATTS